MLCGRQRVSKAGLLRKAKICRYKYGLSPNEMSYQLLQLFASLHHKTGKQRNFRIVVTLFYGL